MWTILVFGVMRLTRKQSYDDLRYSANNDLLMREMVGIGRMENDPQFSLTSIKENLSLLSEDLLMEINSIVIKHGGGLVQKKNEQIKLKTDSYVCETNVHFPTDLNLALDAARKSIELSYHFATRHMLPGWRKSNDWKRRVKSKYLKVARIKNGGGKNKDDRLRKSVEEYLEVLEELQDKVALDLPIFRSKANDPSSLILVEEIRQFHDYLIKHIDLIIRRLIHGETIPHEEKMFSLFEPHIEWITKGKSRPNVELGHRLLITTNQHGLIVDHQVMESITDSEVVPELIDRLSNNYAGKVVSSHSFDKGFYSASNKQKVGEMASVGSVQNFSHFVFR